MGYRLELERFSVDLFLCLAKRFLVYWFYNECVFNCPTGFDTVDAPSSPSILDSHASFLNNFTDNMCSSTTSPAIGNII